MMPRPSTMFEPLEPRLLLDGAVPAYADLGPVEAGGAEIDVPAYSVPALSDWNNDGLTDLLVGERVYEWCDPCGGDLAYGKVRLYLNQGTPTEPAFGAHTYIQADGATLTVNAEGCLGAFPRVHDWNGDGKKDLLLGISSGTIEVYLNTGTDAAPTFGTGFHVEAGPPGSKYVLYAGKRPALDIADWDNDGRWDLIVGNLDGEVRVYPNVGTPTAPDLRTHSLVQSGGTDLIVPSARSSPDVIDLDDDGRKDLLVGNTEGQLYFYANTGTDAAPVFSGGVLLNVSGAPLDLDGTPRSRPEVGDLDADGIPDLLVGAQDGLVRRYDDPPPTGPDLTGTVDMAKAPATLLPGHKKTGRLKGLAAVVTNAGTEAVRAEVRINAYASANQTLDKGADALLGGVTVKLKLAVGQAKSCRLKKLLVPELPPGAYHIIIDVDATGVVAEISETNNTAASAGTIAWIEPQRDLSGTAAQPKEEWVRAGAGKEGVIKKLTVEVGNRGNVAAVGTITIDFYASADGTLDKGADTKLGTLRVTLNLKPGKSGRYTLKNIVVPVLTPGDYSVLAEFDALGEIAETNEANNVAASPGTIEWRA
jgi:hypothetical protein